MLPGVFRTKETKVIAAILAVILIIISIGIFNNYSNNRKFIETAVIAENHLKAGNYEQAVEAYKKAMTIRGMNQELLTIGLADAYVGMNKYDMALEVLRSCYQKTAGIQVKEKIEEVTSEKTEYEYSMAALRAEDYFTNKEYDKAIAEYEKAKLIKSREVTSYQRIAEAYIEEGAYEAAHEEVIEGQELTQDESFAILLDRVNSYLVKEQYDSLINQALEYVYQENYKDGIAKYEEAAELLPKDYAAYKGLAEIYLLQGKYDKAILLLESTLNSIDEKELQSLLNKAYHMKEKAEETK